MLAATPSRIAIALLVFSLAGFLWTYGFPHQLMQPAKPVIDHYDHKNVHSQPIIPAPSLPPQTHAIWHPAKPTHHGDRPVEENENRWNDATAMPAQPTATVIAEFEEDGGRWEDQGKLPVARPAHHGTSNATIVEPVAPAEEPPSNEHISKFCENVHGAPHVMIILRTSKAEIQEKFPAHLNGLLSCVPNFAIFSDHAGEIEGIPVYNALDSIDGEAKRTHDEFREYQIMHADPEHKPDAGKTKNLDKWKFLPMVYKAYHLRPSARFFVFIELDTSLSWTNTLQWANRLDYRIPYYSGSPTFIDGVQLAQRGSGIMVSQGAMRRYAKSYDELYRSKWEVKLGKGCCGDAALASALNDAHVEFYSSWPLLQGEQPASLDYSKKHWCAPAITWHNANGETLDAIWTSQKAWTAKHGWDTPFLYRDAFETFVMPHISAKKDAWDNMASDTKIAAPQGRQKQIKEEEERSRKHKEAEEAKKHSTLQTLPQPGASLKSELSRPPHAKPTRRPPPATRPPKPNKPSKREDKKKEPDWDKLSEAHKDAGDNVENCQKTCEAVENCLQWRYTTKGDGECHLGKVMRLGKKMDGKGDKWASGWMETRMEQVKKEWECKEPSWGFYQ